MPSTDKCLSTRLYSGGEKLFGGPSENQKLLGPCGSTLPWIRAAAKYAQTCTFYS